MPIIDRLMLWLAGIVIATMLMFPKTWILIPIGLAVLKAMGTGKVKK